MKRFIPLLLILSNCGYLPTWQAPVAKAPANRAAELQDRVHLYQELVGTVQDPAGFIDTAGCDSLLFSSLLAAGGGSVDLTAARSADGQWYRRPLSQAECYTAGASQSSISRDQLLGVMLAAFVNHRLDILVDLWHFGKEHDWIMGEGPLEIVYFTPDYQRLLAHCLANLGYHDEYVDAARSYPLPWVSGLTGFRAHLQVLQIYLYVAATGKVSADISTLMAQHVARDPKNALYAAVQARLTGKSQDRAAELLLNTAWWPADRLPTTSDRCEEWLPQRDQGADWEPCSPEKQLSGADLLFVAAIVLGRI